MTFVVRQAIAEDGKYAQMICDEWRIPRNFAERGLLSVHRNTFRKNAGGKAVIAFSDDGLWAGFCYIETRPESLLQTQD